MFVFVCLCLTQIHISEPVWTRLCTRLSLRLEETVGYVWSENVWPFSTFLVFLLGSECKLLGTTWLPAQDTSATALHPWFLRVLVWRHFVADDTFPYSSATALYLWFLLVLVWPRGKDVVAGDTCAFLLEVSCTMSNAYRTPWSERNSCV
jgi:hypothetical protein